MVMSEGVDVNIFLKSISLIQYLECFRLTVTFQVYTILLLHCDDPSIKYFSKASLLHTPLVRCILKIVHHVIRLIN